jgi:N-acetylmuramoyl-L-alanine amidase
MRAVPGYLLIVLTLLVLPGHLPAGPATDEKRLSVYSPAADYFLVVSERNGRDYVGLLELLEPLGQVSARTDGLHWRLRFKALEMEFTRAKSHAKVGRQEIDLGAPFVLENGRGLVPVTSLNTLLPHLGGPLNFNEGARRLFLGNVGTHFTAQLSHTTPPRLVMNFTAPVNPTIATEPGKLRMVFHREPVVAPSTPTLTFSDKAIPSATFAESNGLAEITVSSSVSLMASFSNEGRTITISAESQPTLAAQPMLEPGQVPAATLPPSGPGPAVPAAPGSTPVPAPPPGQKSYFAVVDASHGGDDRGVALTGQLAEKDVTLAIARRLRLELEARSVPTLVLRDSDADLTLDQRATLANATHAALYISLHAASDGNGVRLYTAMLPAGGDNNGPFLAWDVAQSRFVPSSVTAASGVASELQRKQIPVRVLTAPLRPLNNITTAALAVEVAPPPGLDASQLNSPVYQQIIAATVANAVAAMRDKLGAPR